MKQLVGKVVSEKMQKSAVVEIARIWRHPIYKKGVKRSKRYIVDNTISAHKGDKVALAQTRPTSGKKRFKISKILK